MKTTIGLAHEIWAAAQLAPGEGITDGVGRIAALLQQTKSTWINVEEALPPDGLYMVWVKDETNKFGGYRAVVEYGSFQFFADMDVIAPPEDADEEGYVSRYGWSYERESEGDYDYLRFDLNGKVTHWQPLPERVLPPTVGHGHLCKGEVK